MTINLFNSMLKTETTVCERFNNLLKAETWLVFEASFTSSRGKNLQS